MWMIIFVANECVNLLMMEAEERGGGHDSSLGKHLSAETEDPYHRTMSKYWCLHTLHLILFGQLGFSTSHRKLCVCLMITSYGRNVTSQGYSNMCVCVYLFLWFLAEFMSYYIYRFWQCS